MAASILFVGECLADAMLNYVLNHRGPGRLFWISGLLCGTLDGRAEEILGIFRLQHLDCPSLAISMARLGPNGAD